MFSRIDSDFRDISGLIARSHTLSIRNCLNYLESKFHKREFAGIHAIYLMVLLRIADYLQIQPTRAPKETLAIRHFNSPISKGEWKVHECIRNITYAGDDPEAIFIEAVPKDVHTFLKVKNWIEGIQNELDLSWAVIGEVYGRFQKEGLDKLGIALRRIRSNIDDVQEFSKTVSYVPEKISFQAANPDLLKLLIAPLYGEKPEIGVRELLQNAVDAVRERDEYIKHSKNPAATFTGEQDVIIAIHMDEKNETPVAISVEDFGIGMTLETVKEYFLKAGATYRKSYTWKKNYEDEAGNSKVLRSGRFGVGVLAAFLIGDEIEVHTRFVGEEKENGVRLKANLDTEAIEINRIEKVAAGTTIKVKLNKKTTKIVEEWVSKEYEYLDEEGDLVNFLYHQWDWYGLTKPKVLRIIYPSNKRIKQEYNLPLCESLPRKNWRHIKSEGFTEIQWTFEKKFPLLTCNGIFIKKQNYNSTDSDYILKDNYHKIDMPKLSIFDPNGKLPLNLQRDETTGKLPFNFVLLKDVINSFFSNLIKHLPNNVNSKFHKFLKAHIPILRKNLIRIPESYYGSEVLNYELFFVFKNNLAITEPYFISKNVSTLTISNIELALKNSSFFIEIIKKQGLLFFDFPNDNIGVTKMIDIMRFCTRAFSYSYINASHDPKYGFAKFLKTKNALLIVPSKFYTDYCKKKIKISKKFISDLTVVKEKNGLTVLSYGENKLTESIAELLEKNDFKMGFGDFYAEWILDNSEDHEYEISTIGKEWLSIFELPYIPFDMEERREKLAAAYEKLKPYWDFEP